MSYDIFISYRRKGAGAGVAGELQAKLENRGYKVFLDVDNIGSGAFPEQIDNAIKSCNDFLLILSPGMLDRCVDEEDWVRHEIVLAEQYGKNIIGVSLPGFVMPEAHTLPEPLKDVPEKQVFLWSHEYRNASINKIVDNLISLNQKKKRTRRHVAFGAVGTLAAFAVVWLMLSKPLSDSQGEDNPVYAVDTAKLIRNQFSGFLREADSMLKLVPNPTDQEEFATFMEAMVLYDSALMIIKTCPSIVRDSLGLEAKVSDLQNLRKERLDRELEAASKFLDVDQMDFAMFRFENAKVLAVEGEESLLENVERRIQ